MKITASAAREALAIIGAGFLAFGFFDLYRPLGFLFLGAVMVAPFVLAMRKG